MENQTENKGVYFTSLKLQNVRCFGEEAVLDLSDGKGGWARWNVILGDNGTGKTTLLQCLAGIAPKSHTGPHYTVLTTRLFSGKHWLNLAPSSDFDFAGNESRVIANLFLEWSKSFTEIEYLRLYSTRTDFQEDQVSKPHENVTELKVLGYGANRFMSSSSLTRDEEDSAETLFNIDAKLINAEEFLLSANYNANIDSDLKQIFIHRRDLVKNILVDILPGVKDLNFPPPTTEYVKPRVEFKTEFGWVTIRQLSLGYKTMVAWMVDVAARMFERYPDSENPLNEPVVILVDEIDLHLHPQWQRKIFDYLTEKFPKAQFIVTAHSPLVVQSAPKDANIILLRKDTDEAGNSYVKIDNDVESVRNWRLDQILTSDLFGLESARNLEVEKAMKERTELLQKNDLSGAEQERLAELNNMAHGLPTAENRLDREAMDVIREAAAAIKKNQDAA